MVKNGNLGHQPEKVKKPTITANQNNGTQKIYLEDIRIKAIGINPLLVTFRPHNN